MNEIWKSSTYRIVRVMRDNYNRPRIIAEWKAALVEWAAREAPTAQVQALRAWLPLFQVRPFYTAAELAPLMPALAAYLRFKPLYSPRSPRRVENRLRYVGLPVLANADGGDTFVNPATGRYERYFIVERLGHWSKQQLSQEQFERELFQ